MSAHLGPRIECDPRAGRRLVLDGEMLGDPYHVASLTLAFFRGSALARERCWALALGAAALAASASPEAAIRIERTEGTPPGIVVHFCGQFCVKGAIEAEQALHRLRGLGFSIISRGQGSDRVLELRNSDGEA